MPTTATELNNHRSWATHHDKNPKWPSERKAEAEKQARKTALAQIKARRANRVAAAANVDSTAAPLVCKSTHRKNTNCVEVGEAAMDIDTASTSSSRSSATRTSPPSSAASSKSPSPVHTRELQAPEASAVRAKAAAKPPEAALASMVLSTKPLPSPTSLDSMFDDEKDVGRVYDTEEKKSSVETSSKASSSQSKKRKLPFGDDDSEGESDFEDLRRSEKPKTSAVDLDTSKHKHEKSVFMPVCQSQPRLPTRQSSSTHLPWSVVKRAAMRKPCSTSWTAFSFGGQWERRAIQVPNQTLLQPSTR